MPLVIASKSAATQSLPAVIREAEAARYLGIDPKKLRRLVYEKRGPRSVKLGRERLYPREDFLAWIAMRTR